MRIAAVCITGLVMMGLGACAEPPVSEGGFDAADPGSKLYAITRAGNEKDASAIPHLIQQLDSDDQAVRMYAIGALERITGQRKGYVYYAPQAERDAAIERWLKAYKQGELAQAASP
ncbi:hypothetical protein HED60_03595 [Planctomycetales bacterium ZRK34]|nr:hypothetical protein HED60_03595 [Planctomycetales bacterium ZRK34]